MYRTYVLATEPISAHERRELGLSDVMVWDAERPYHYARWTPEHRLLLGGGDRLVRPGGGAGNSSRQRSRVARILRNAISSPVGHQDGVRVGGTVRDDARHPSVHRPTSPLSPSLVRLGLRRERHDVRLSWRRDCCSSDGRVRCHGTMRSSSLAGCVDADRTRRVTVPVTPVASPRDASRTSDRCKSGCARFRFLTIHDSHKSPGRDTY